MVSAGDGDLAGLLDAAAGAAARLGTSTDDRFEVARAFLAGPPTVRVAGPGHAERGQIASLLAGSLPGAAVHEAASAAPASLWDVAVVVTPADQVLARAEERFVQEAAAAGRPVLVVVSRLSLFGDAAAQAQARRELEEFRITPLLAPRQVPWAYLGAGGSGDAEIARRVADAARRESGHRSAVTAFLRSQVDEAVSQATRLLAVRRAEQEQLKQLRQQVNAQRASARESARTALLTAVGRLRALDGAIDDATVQTENLTRAWLDSGGLLPWADVECPLRRAVASLAACADGLVAGYRDAIVGELARVEGEITDGLRELRLPTGASGDRSVRLADERLDRAVARMRGADVSPALAAAHDTMKNLLDALRRDAGNDDDGDGQLKADDSSWDDDLEVDDDADGDADESSRRMRFAGLIPHRKPPKPRPSAALVQVHDTLSRFLESYLRPRVHELVDAVEAAFPPAGRTAVDEGFAALDLTLDSAAAALGDRYSWSDAYTTLVTLRAQIG